MNISWAWTALALIGSMLSNASSGAQEIDSAESSDANVDVIVVVGAGGSEEYAESFDQWANEWKAVATDAGLAFLRIGEASDSSDPTDFVRLRELLKSQERTSSPRPLWLILIGHGTWDGKLANFNLVGKDISATTLAGWLRWIERPLCVVNCSSSSGPFINRLSGKNRIIVTATKSGNEQNYARFGQAMANAISATDADLDHDDAVSVKEAFIKATDEIKRLYAAESRLQTEHALLDDNGDKLGSDASLVRQQTSPLKAGTVDGALASRVSIPTGQNRLQLSDEALQERDRLEAELRKIVAKELPTPELRKQALPILKALAKLYAPQEEQTP